MFSIQRSFIGTEGEVKFSQAHENATFENQTKGLALKYVHQGTEHYQIKDAYIPVAAGQFMILPEAQSYHAHTKIHSAQTKGICIDIHSSYLLSDLQHLYEEKLLFEIPFQCQHFSPLSQTFHTLHSHAIHHSSPQTDWPHTFQQIKKELHTFKTLIQYIEPRLHTQAKKRTTQKFLLSKLFQAKDLIHQHYTRPLSLTNLALHIGLSPFYLTRLFQTCFQQSPTQLHTSLRMEAAAKLLSLEHLSLSDIAFTLGYHDLAAFSNQFKRHYQMSPSHMRKELP